MNSLHNLLLLLFCAPVLTGCTSPGSYTELDGDVSGHVRVDATWLVALGTADADLSTVIPSGVIIKYPLNVHEGTWLAVNLATGETHTGELHDPLPPLAALLYGEGEWEALLGSPPLDISDE